jgi:hypothetical protein
MMLSVTFCASKALTQTDVWQIVEPPLEDSATWVIIADDSVQDKGYSNFIELIKKQHWGNEQGLVKGTGFNPLCSLFRE